MERKIKIIFNILMISTPIVILCFLSYHDDLTKTEFIILLAWWHLILNSLLTKQQL